MGINFDVEVHIHIHKTPLFQEKHHSQFLYTYMSWLVVLSISSVSFLKKQENEDEMFASLRKSSFLMHRIAL